MKKLAIDKETLEFASQACINAYRRHPVKPTILDMTWWYRIISALPGVRIILRLFGNPLDHDPENYLKGVKKL